MFENNVIDEQEVRLRAEFHRLIKIIKASYPNSKVLDNQETVEIWYRMLKDIPLDRLEYSIATHVATNKFPPSVAELRESAIVINKKSWGEGWRLVLSAISKFGSYGVKDALEYIRADDEVAYKVTKRLNFRELCMSENIDIARANFRMMYENEQSNYDYVAKLPPMLQNQRDEMISNQKKLNSMVLGLADSMSMNKGD